MDSKRAIGFRIAGILLLMAYLTALIGIPFCHTLEILSAENKCPACNETSMPSSNCYNTPRQHNHPLHNHNCQICLSMQDNFGTGQIPKSADSLPDAFSTAIFQPVADKYFSSFVFNCNGSRGPPLSF